MGKHLVTPDDIQKMNELYLQLHTYAAVSREVGFSATTVKKYIDKNYISSEKIIENTFHYTDTKPNIKYPKNSFEWNEIIQFMYGEKEEMDELRKEVLV